MNNALNDEQKEAVSFTRSTVVVASAGTGKTTTLAGAYLHLLEGGLSPREILAITFTEKAAAEMRERIRRDVLQNVLEEPEETRWRRDLNQITQAPIGTIHAFCAQIIREQAVWLGIDPHYTILDEAQADRRLEGVVREILDEQIRRNDPDLLSLIRQYDLKGRGGTGLVDRLKGIVKRWNEHGFAMPSSPEGLGPQAVHRRHEADEFERKFKKGLTDIRTGYEQLLNCRRAYGKNAETYLNKVRLSERAIRIALDTIQWNGPPEMARHLEYFSDVLSKSHRIADHPDNDIIRNALRIFRGYLGPEADAPLLSWFGAFKSLPLSAVLEKLGIQARLRYRMAKDRSSLDFTDLLLEARRLLRKNRAIRRRYQNRYQAVLVDEFQDTDLLQAEILLLITESHPSSHPIDEDLSSKEVIQSSRPHPRKLFIVGDTKQSIYSFRGADVSVFRTIQEKISAMGHPPIALRKNYRMAPELIDFTNSLFSRLLPPPPPPSTDPLPEPYATFFSESDHLEPGVPTTTGKGRMIWMTADPTMDADTARRIEASAIAHLILQWKREGLIERFDQVALLFRSRSKIGVYREELKGAGIPHFVVKAGRFFARQEVVELLGLLQIIRDPGEDLTLAQFMTSAMGLFHFADLAEVVSSGSGASLWEKIHRLPFTVSPRVKELTSRLLHLLDRPLSLRDRLHPHEIIQMVLEQTHYDAALTALPDGEERIANIGKFIELTRSLSREDIQGLDACVDQLLYMAASGHEEPEAPLYGEKEDVVRLMTVHQAKGLEFEAVIVPNLGASPDNRPESTAIDPQLGILCEATYGLDRKRIPNTWLLSIRDRQKKKEIEEEKRLFYVALTRAKRILLLGEGYRKGAKGDWLSYLTALDPSLPIERLEAKDLQAVSNPSPSVQISPAMEDLQEGGIQAFRWTPSPPSHLSLSPSQLDDLSRCERMFYLIHIAGLSPFPPSLRRSHHTLERGIVAHWVLELLDPNLPLSSCRHQIEHLIASAPAAYLHKLEMEEKAHIASVLSERMHDEAWRSVFLLPDLQREVPVMLALQQDDLRLMIRGKIDLIAMDDVPLLVDFKYERYPEEDPQKYMTQTEVYALALMRYLGSTTVRTEVRYVLDKERERIVRLFNRPEEIERRLLSIGQRLSKKQRRAGPEIWSKAEPSFCDQIRCGFRSECWRKD